MKMSALAARAFCARIGSGMNTSVSRVMYAFMPGVALIWRASSRPTARVTSFSRLPVGPIAPGSWPPWPGSIATINGRMPGAILIREASLGSTGRGGISSLSVPATTPDAAFGMAAAVLPGATPIGAVAPFKIAAGDALPPVIGTPVGALAVVTVTRLGVLLPALAGIAVLVVTALVATPGRGVGTPVATVVGTGAVVTVGMADAGTYGAGAGACGGGADEARCADAAKAAVARAASACAFTGCAVTGRGAGIAVGAAVVVAAVDATGVGSPGHSITKVEALPSVCICGFSGVTGVASSNTTRNVPGTGWPVRTEVTRPAAPGSLRPRTPAESGKSTTNRLGLANDSVLKPPLPAS